MLVVQCVTVHGLGYAGTSGGTRGSRALYMHTTVSLNEAALFQCAWGCRVRRLVLRAVSGGWRGIKMADSPLALSPAMPVVSARRGEVRSNGYLGRREDAGGTSDGARSSVVERERTPCSSSPAWDGRGGNVRARRVVHATYICVCSCLFRRAV